MPRSFLMQYHPLHNDTFFFGTDNYQPALTQSLETAGGVRYAPRLDPADKAIGSAGALVPMVVDFFLMVRSSVFLGNPLSSVSWNVCAVRWHRTVPLPCPTLPQSSAHGCFPFPDLTIPVRQLQISPFQAPDGVFVQRAADWRARGAHHVPASCEGHRQAQGPGSGTCNPPSLPRPIVLKLPT